MQFARQKSMGGEIDDAILFERLGAQRAFGSAGAKQHRTGRAAQCGTHGLDLLTRIAQARQRAQKLGSHRATTLTGGRQRFDRLAA